MGRPIDFNDHPRLEAGEVGNEATENNLTTESEARDLLAPDTLPQPLFSTRSIASEASRESR
jgi:hypothetical protein